MHTVLNLFSRARYLHFRDGLPGRIRFDNRQNAAASAGDNGVETEIDNGVSIRQAVNGRTTIGIEIRHMAILPHLYCRHIAEIESQLESTGI